MPKAIATHSGISKKLNGQPQPCMTADKPEHHGKLPWSWHSHRKSSYTPAKHAIAAGMCLYNISACKHGDLTANIFPGAQEHQINKSSKCESDWEQGLPLRHNDDGTQWLTQRAAICEAVWKLVSKGSGWCYNRRTPRIAVQPRGLHTKQACSHQ